MGTTGRTRRWSMAATLCASMLVVAGCTDDEPTDGSGNDPTSQTPSPSPSKSESDGPVEPEVPDAMANVDKAGAKAFVQYYWALADYAQATGHTKRLREYAFESCVACKGGADGIDDVYRAGGWMRGGETTVIEQEVSVVRADSPRLFRSIVTVKFAEQKILPKTGGRRETHSPARVRLKFLVGEDESGQWRVGRWSDL